MKIYLASKSPRRQELLSQMGIEFELLLVDPPEVVGPNETPEMYSTRVTRDKLLAAWEKLMLERKSPMPVLCADTEVVLDNKVLGKAANREAAFDMLKSLSERSHSVITSVGIQYFDYQKIVMDKTIVTLSELSDLDINRYLDTENYVGKSGSYSIQSYFGQFISRIDGCFYSVMGLPLNTVRLLLTDLKKGFD